MCPHALFSQAQSHISMANRGGSRVWKRGVKLKSKKKKKKVTAIIATLCQMYILPPQKHLRCKKGAPKKLQVPGTQCKKQKEKSA